LFETSPGFSLTQAYAKGFRANGGRIIENAMVQELPRRGDRITHVVTDHGSIEVETVVNAAGLWARQVGWMAGVEIPAGVVEHQYLVTEKSDLIPNGLPALRDPDGGFYVKPEPGALATGGWERQTRAVNPQEGFPWQCERHLFDADMDRLEEFFAPATRRLPVLNELGVHTIVNGPIPISPDGEPVMGPVPGVDNFFAACACYTQLCNERGGIEADVTIIRRSEYCFWLITGSGFCIRDRHWIETSMRAYSKHRGAAWDLCLRDISSAYGATNLSGPQARSVLGKVCDEDVSHQGFAFMTAKELRIGYAPALAFRVTYIGELGWQLYIPSEYLQYAYETLFEAGREFDICNMGYRAIDSLRIEKRYLVWGVDITPDYNPYEAGLQFLIDWTKGDFIGAEALARTQQDGARQKLVCLALDDPLHVFGGEAILINGGAIAQTTSGNFGYTVGKSLVLGYLPIEVLEQNEVMVEAFGIRTSASIIRGAAYDPKREKTLC
jgi:glycine cleavage system aminomethyltransferase T